MAFTQADLEAINAAIATGAKRVRFQTHEVEYHSMTEMLRARDIIKDEVNPPVDSSGVMYAEYDGGY